VTHKGSNTSSLTDFGSSEILTTARCLGEGASAVGESSKNGVVGSVGWVLLRLTDARPAVFLVLSVVVFVASVGSGITASVVAPAVSLDHLGQPLHDARLEHSGNRALFSLFAFVAVVLFFTSIVLAAWSLARLISDAVRDASRETKAGDA